jgi:competence protein ComEC
VFAVSRGDSAQRVQGRVQLYLKPGVGGHFSMYDTLQVKARLSDLNSRYPSYLAYLRRNGVSHAAYGQALLVAGEAQGPLAMAARVQKRLSKQLEQLMKDSTRLAIAQAMFLGDTDGLRPEDQAAFSQTGTSHVLSISGMHVGIIFLFLNFLLSPLSLLPGGKRLKYAMVLVVLIAYALIAGGAPPVVRSTLMFGTVLIFKILWQRYHLLNVLAAAALAQMLFEPGVIFNVGFQLSYVAVWGIVGLMPKFQAWFSAGHRLLDTVYEWIGVSLAATLATLPLTLAHFGQFPVHFILSNLLVSAIGFVLVLSGFLMVMFCYVPGLNAWLASVCEFLIEVLQAIAESVSALPHPLIRSMWDWEALLLLALELGFTLLLLLLPRGLRHLRGAGAPAPA